jgi:hypothetical protein
MYEIRNLYILVTNPKEGDLKTLGIDGRMNLEEKGCKGMDLSNLLRKGWWQPLVNLWILYSLYFFCALKHFLEI